MIILNKKQTILGHNFSQKYLQKDIWIFSLVLSMMITIGPWEMW